MPFFMLVLFAAVALVIILAGLYLSPRSKTSTPTARPSRVRNRTTVSEYPVERMVRRASRTVAEPPMLRQAMSVRQVVEISEPRPWMGVWQSLAVGRVFKRRRRGEPVPWMGITLILLSVALLFMVLMRIVMPNTMLMAAFSWSPLQQTTSAQQNSPQAPSFAASQALLRISQLDPNQYNSNQEYNLWAYSACSSAAMTEVINAYGHHYRVTDILKVEAAIGEITPQLGLLEDVGVAHTMSRFNFKTTWGHNLSLDGILSVANSGRPVIVSWPPDRYAGGHLVVVTGGNATTVYLADSSLYNRHSLSRSQFMQWWEGFYAIATPN